MAQRLILITIDPEHTELTDRLPLAEGWRIEQVSVCAAPQGGRQVTVAVVLAQEAAPTEGAKRKARGIVNT